MSIHFSGLIDLDWSKPIWDKIITYLDPEETLGYSIGSGNYMVSLGGILKDTYDPGPYSAYIDSIVSRIDDLIDLDFRKQSEGSDSLVDFYRVAYQGDGVLGSTYHDDSIYWTDIEFALTGDEKQDKHVILHEFGHALGLNHPYDDGANPYYSTDDTVMSYNIGSGGYSDWFTDSDVQALLTLWGAEDDMTAPPTPPQQLPEPQDSSVVIVNPTSSAPLRIIGNNQQNTLEGSELHEIIDGGMGSDYLIGAAGNDIFIDSNGLDVLVGGPGADIFAIYGSEGLYSTKKRDRAAEESGTAYLFDVIVKRKNNGKKTKRYLYDPDISFIDDFNILEDLVVIDSSVVDERGYGFDDSGIPGVEGTFLLSSDNKNVLAFIAGQEIPDYFIGF